MKTLIIILLSLSGYAQADSIITCDDGAVKINSTQTYNRGTCYEAPGFFLDCDEIYHQTEFRWEDKELIFSVSAYPDIVISAVEETVSEDCDVNWENLKIFNNLLNAEDHNPDFLDSESLVAVLDSYHSLDEGYLSLYVGESIDISGEAFHDRLHQHVNLVADTMAPFGQLKYYVYANNDRELAIIQWPSKEAMDFAFEKKGNIIWDDANEFLHGIVWEKLDHLPGGQITQGFIDKNINRVE